MSLTSGAVVNSIPGGLTEHLTAEEVVAALETLAIDDKFKLHSIERAYLGGTGFKRGELAHEAICRAILGQRRCPRDVNFIAFLALTMRSVAYHERKRRKSLRPLNLAPKRDEGQARSSPEVASDGLNPEEHLLTNEDRDLMQAFHAHFNDDQEAQLVLMGWADGLSGQELRSAVGLDQAALDYAGKRIRRRLRKAYPNGWTP